ncbi:MAG TPA: alpha/beta hydrolase-fold protein [Pirellulales bacterium]
MDAHDAVAWPTIEPTAAWGLDLETSDRGSALLTGGCAVYAPLHYEPKYRYPLVVWLHGSGGSEAQLRRIMPFVSLRNYVAVAPRGVEPVGFGEDGSRFGYSWNDACDAFSLAGERVFEAIDHARERFQVNPNRIFLAGYESGGTTALRLALTHPESFAGVLSLEGPLPRTGRIFSSLKAVKKLPIFLAHSRRSRSYPADWVSDDLKALNSAGMHATLREYPGAQELSTQMLSDVDRWIMNIVASPSR